MFENAIKHLNNERGVSFEKDSESLFSGNVLVGNENVTM